MVMFAMQTVVCRSGALIATAWAAMRINGLQGYQDATRDILRTVAAFKAAVKSIPELEIIGQPAGSVVAFTSSKGKVFSIYKVCS